VWECQPKPPWRSYRNWLTELGCTDWIELFAKAADDHQWIHVDPERAKHSPFGGTIAHGYLTLSMILPRLEQLLHVEVVTTKLNYGLNSTPGSRLLYRFGPRSG
jgi:hypothetical protein